MSAASAIAPLLGAISVNITPAPGGTATGDAFAEALRSVRGADPVAAEPAQAALETRGSDVRRVPIIEPAADQAAATTSAPATEAALTRGSAPAEKPVRLGKIVAVEAVAAAAVAVDGRRISHEGLMSVPAVEPAPARGHAPDPDVQALNGGPTQQAASVPTTSLASTQDIRRANAGLAQAAAIPGLVPQREQLSQPATPDHAAAFADTTENLPEGRAPAEPATPARSGTPTHSLEALPTREVPAQSAVLSANSTISSSKQLEPIRLAAAIQPASPPSSPDISTQRSEPIRRVTAAQAAAPANGPVLVADGTGQPQSVTPAMAIAPVGNPETPPQHMQPARSVPTVAPTEAGSISRGSVLPTLGTMPVQRAVPGRVAGHTSGEAAPAQDLPPVQPPVAVRTITRGQDTLLPDVSSAPVVTRIKSPDAEGSPPQDAATADAISPPTTQPDSRTTDLPRPADGIEVPTLVIGPNMAASLHPAPSDASAPPAPDRPRGPEAASPGWDAPSLADGPMGGSANQASPVTIVPGTPSPPTPVTGPGVSGDQTSPAAIVPGEPSHPTQVAVPGTSGDRTSPDAVVPGAALPPIPVAVPGASVDPAAPATIVPGASSHPTPVAVPDTTSNPTMVALPPAQAPLPTLAAQPDIPVTAAAGWAADHRSALRPVDTDANPAQSEPIPGGTVELMAPPVPPAAAPATAPVVAAPPAHPAPAAEQVAPALLTLAKAADGSQQITIRLRPAELGMVQVRIATAVSGTTQIEITADNPATLLTLQRDQLQLHRTLDEAGIPAAGRTVTFHVAPAEQAAASGGSGASAGHGNSQQGSNGRTQAGTTDADGSAGRGSHPARERSTYPTSRRPSTPPAAAGANQTPAGTSNRIGLDITA